MSFLKNLNNKITKAEKNSHMSILSSLLDNDEKVFHSIKVNKLSKVVFIDIIAATNKRIIFVRKEGILKTQAEYIPYDSIDKIELEKRVFFKINIITNVNSISVEKVSPLEAQEFVKFVNDKISKSQSSVAIENTSTSTNPTLPEQLSELKDLLEQGYLSEEEFDFKRKKLLDL